jgi:hypothetical protein
MNGDALPAVARLLDGGRGAARRARQARSLRMVTPRAGSATVGAGRANVSAPSATAGGWCVKHDGRRWPGGSWRVAHRSATASAGPADGGAVPGALCGRRLPRRGAERDGWRMVTVRTRRTPNTMAGAGPADGGASRTAARRPVPIQRMVAHCVAGVCSDGGRGELGHGARRTRGTRRAGDVARCGRGARGTRGTRGRAGDAGTRDVIVPGIVVVVPRTSRRKPPAVRQLTSHCEVSHRSSINFGALRLRAARGG